jgi:hypothetical protein
VHEHLFTMPSGNFAEREKRHTRVRLGNNAETSYV